MQTLEKDVDTLVRFFKQKGFDGAFKSPWAEGSLKDCLNYHVNRAAQQRDGLDYFKDVVKTVTENKKQGDVSTVAFTLEYREGVGINVTSIKGNRSVDGEDITSFQASNKHLATMLDAKDVSSRLKLPGESLSI